MERLKANEGHFIFANGCKLHTLTCTTFSMIWQRSMNNINLEYIQSAHFLGSSSAKVIITVDTTTINVQLVYTHTRAEISLECRCTHSTQAEP